MPVPHMLTLREAADRIHVDPRTLRRRIADGTLTAYSRGKSRKIYVRASDVDKLGKLVPRRADKSPTATREGVSSPSSTG